VVRPLHQSPSQDDELKNLGYRVEVWDAAGERVERLVAATSTASLGYAVYYAATREYPGRQLTLSRDGVTLSRWTVRPGG
jgi:hypothetical protein